MAGGNDRNEKIYKYLLFYYFVLEYTFLLYYFSACENSAWGVRVLSLGFEFFGRNVGMEVVQDRIMIYWVLLFGY